MKESVKKTNVACSLSKEQDTPCRFAVRIVLFRSADSTVEAGTRSNTISSSTWLNNMKGRGALYCIVHANNISNSRFIREIERTRECAVFRIVISVHHKNIAYHIHRDNFLAHAMLLEQVFGLVDFGKLRHG